MKTNHNFLRSSHCPHHILCSSLPVSKQNSFALKIKVLLDTARSRVVISIPTPVSITATEDISPASSQQPPDDDELSSVSDSSVLVDPDVSSLVQDCPRVSQRAHEAVQPQLSQPMQPQESPAFRLTNVLVEEEVDRLKRKWLVPASLYCSAGLKKRNEKWEGRKKVFCFESFIK